MMLAALCFLPNYVALFWPATGLTGPVGVAGNLSQRPQATSCMQSCMECGCHTVGLMQRAMLGTNFVP